MAESLSVRFDVSKLERLIAHAPGAADDAIGAAAFEGQRIVQMSFNTSPAGRSYRHGNVTHVASQAGYPPNIDTGKLMNAIYVYKPAALQRIISAGDTEYAAALEFGTTNMQARPFMRPMVAELEREIDGIFERFLSQAIDF